MDWLANFIWHGLIWHNDKFFGIEWGVWKIIGWFGNTVFFSRFFVQWYATEKKKQVVVPPVFWWLSLIGSVTLLCYGLFYLNDSVVIFAYAFTWIPYSRNLVIHYRHKKAHTNCPACGKSCPPQSNFCPHCGSRLTPAGAAVTSPAPRS